MIEGNSETPISPPGVFPIKEVTRSACEALRRAGMNVDPSWVRHEIEQQLRGETPTSMPGIRLAGFLRHARLIP